ncbi:hypothetical protein J6590_083698 [Homalodisca vitripennis]|nr:hypothetical protein J6590_083698 [Homalodisca vitripennis]
MLASHYNDRSFTRHIVVNDSKNKSVHIRPTVTRHDILGSKVTAVPSSFCTLFCPSSWAAGLCEDLIKQNKGENQYKYSTSLIVLIKSATLTDRT